MHALLIVPLHDNMLLLPILRLVYWENSVRWTGGRYCRSDRGSRIDVSSAMGTKIDSIVRNTKGSTWHYDIGTEWSWQNYLHSDVDESVNTNGWTTSVCVDEIKVLHTDCFVNEPYSFFLQRDAYESKSNNRCANVRKTWRRYERLDRRNIFSSLAKNAKNEKEYVSEINIFFF